jgi:hypothetical protein
MVWQAIQRGIPLISKEKKMENHRPFGIGVIG